MSQSLLLISADSVDYELKKQRAIVPGIAYEGDCACSTDSLHLIYGSAEPLLHDTGDCACPADFIQTRADPSESNLIHQTPALYTSNLGSGFHLAVNPSCASSLALLNRPALDLLQCFDQSHSLAEGVHLAGNPRGGMDIAHQMASLGLLIPTGVVPKLHSSPPQTLTAWLHVTNECNLRCHYCYLEKTAETMTKTTGLAAVEAVFRSAIQHNFRGIKLKYAGGEPTQRMELVAAMHRRAQALAQQYQLGLDGVVLSNGVGLSGPKIECLQALNLRISISLDGIRAVHDAQRPFPGGGSSFASVERSLGRLTRAGLTPSLTITLTSRNLEGLPEVVAYALRNNLPFSINFFRENSCAADDLGMNESILIDAMRQAMEVIEGQLPPYSLLSALLDRTRLDCPHDRPCGVGISYMTIDPQGRVAKCHMTMNHPVGDIAQSDPFLPVLKDADKLQNPAVDEKTGCQDCQWCYLCAGGCPLLSQQISGNSKARSPYCSVYQALIPEVLRLEGLRLLKYSQQTLH